MRGRVLGDIAADRCADNLPDLSRAPVDQQRLGCPAAVHGGSDAY
jgi:hypothetical protein